MRTKGKRLTSETLNEIKAFIDAGVSRTEIAKEFNVTLDMLRHRFGSDPEKLVCGRRINSAEMVPKMQELRHQGLSNSQIAHDLGISDSTVRYYIGNQPSGVKAEYGSIVSKVTGEKFSKELEAKPVEQRPRPTRLITKHLKRVSYRESLQGATFEYICDSKGQVTIKLKQATYEIVLDQKTLGDFIAELCEAMYWLDDHKDIFEEGLV